ncbi:hypothetical protein O181_012964 [Austropuccinia psidii MF-1]|uniref:Uncharacterized protein n=1 Tax=Austropuccinia psidii MF-1 TaxID=1389203 RepID=A0A9Q3BVJ3_9BASI|nr:hypothetical protein [Austropuccinia psidii MF-1]
MSIGREMEKEFEEKTKKIKLSPQSHSLAFHAKAIGVLKATSALGKSIMDWVKARIHISKTNPMLPEVPRIQEEESLRSFLLSKKEMDKTQIRDSFTSLVKNKKKVGSLERNYIIEKEFKKASSLQVTSNYKVSQQALD